MKANELMIGDWVVINENHPDCPFTRKVDIGDLSFFTKFAPIHLTAEILEKNGFRYIQPSKLMFIPDDGGSISYGVETHYVEIGYDGSVRKNMGYVHELQHALRLCGLNDLADSIII